MPDPLPADTRGIVDPAAMMRVVDFARAPAGDALAGLVEWFWSVRWDLPDGDTHDQQVLNHPSGHISVGTVDDDGPLAAPEGRVYGVQQGVSHRHLVGTGWTVAARTTIGGFGVILGRSARSIADRQLSFAEAFGPSGDGFGADVAAAGDLDARTGVLRRGLEEIVARADSEAIAEARQVVEVAALAEHDRAVCRVEQLADAAGVSVRSLQRLFDRHVGASPSFVIRRWRIIEAAEMAHAAHGDGDPWRGWADVAAQLGYADQAHLTRDFTAHLGVAPAAYVEQTRTPPA